MDHFSEFSIPILGLRDGEYQFDYQLDSSFFSRFEDSPITDADLHVAVQLDKRSSMLIWDMQLKGTTAAVCDKCTVPIRLPLDDEMELIVKHSETPNEDDEVVFIHPSTSHFNLAKYLYEFAVLSLPLVNVYDCQSDENPPCNFDILEKIEKNRDHNSDNPVWDVLKDIKK